MIKIHNRSTILLALAAALGGSVPAASQPLKLPDLVLARVARGVAICDIPDYWVVDTTDRDLFAF